MSSHSGTVQAGPDLGFEVLDVKPVEFAASPALAFVLRISVTAGIPVRSLQLRTQVRIAAPRRPYDTETKERLSELFGSSESWGRNVRSFPWTDTSVNVPGFEQETVAQIQVPCTYDLNVTASKYLAAVREGGIPLDLLFSGSVFYESAAGIQIVQIPWEKEASYSLPAQVWHDLMDRYFPGTSWLRLDRDVFDRLWSYRSKRALLTWDRTLEELLNVAEANARSVEDEREAGENGRA